jgi:nucleoside-diphosphate-sugar epimerase
MGKTILVTGAAGFIGSHLCEALLDLNCKVIGIDNFDPFYSRREKEMNLNYCKQFPTFFFFEGSAGDSDLLNRIQQPIDVVVHLAAKAGVQPSLKNASSYIETNIGVTNTILEWMHHEQVNKLVFASSSSVYGNNAKIPFEESDPVNEPISPYAFTKRSCEIMNYTYHSLYNFDIINLRFFTVYGERQRPDLAIRKFVHNMFSGKPIILYGDGSSARDYTYYSDTVNGIISAINYICKHEKVWDIVNLGNNSPITLRELVKTVAEVTQIQPVLIYEKMKPGDVNITYANIDRGKKILNYQPQVPLHIGIENFVNWYRKLYLEAGDL